MRRVALFSQVTVLHAPDRHTCVLEVEQKASEVAQRVITLLLHDFIREGMIFSRFMVHLRLVVVQWESAEGDSVFIAPVVVVGEQERSLAKTTQL